MLGAIPTGHSLELWKAAYPDIPILVYSELSDLLNPRSSIHYATFSTYGAAFMD